MECTTHHNACDCREQLMRQICLDIIKEHDVMANYFYGLGKKWLPKDSGKKRCNCHICKKIRKLYKIKY